MEANSSYSLTLTFSIETLTRCFPNCSFCLLCFCLYRSFLNHGCCLYQATDGLFHVLSRPRSGCWHSLKPLTRSLSFAISVALSRSPRLAIALETLSLIRYISLSRRLLMLSVALRLCPSLSQTLKASTVSILIESSSNKEREFRWHHHRFIFFDITTASSNIGFRGFFCFELKFDIVFCCFEIWQLLTIELNIDVVVLTVGLLN